jgi:hypothetical protein
MSYIEDIETIFLSYKPDGSFGFQSDFEQDNKIRNISKANHPVCFIEDNTTGTMTPSGTGNMDDSPRITIYFLTKFDDSGNMVQSDTNKKDKHTKLIEPMKILGSSVLYQYFASQNIKKDSVQTLNYEEIVEFGTSEYSGCKFIFTYKRYLETSCP